MLKSIKQETTNQNINPRNLIRNILMISAAILFIGFIVYSPITQKAANAPSYELSFDTETVKMIAGESVSLKVYIERNGFEEPVTLKAEDLPDGFDVEFEENPVEGDSTNAWIYSPANVLQCENPIMIDSYENPEPNAKLRLMVNCGIDWVEQFGSARGDAIHNDIDIGNAVTTDSNGNIYVVGNTFGTVDPQNPNANTDSDVWLAKYDNAGNQEFIRQFGGTASDRVSEVKVDNEGSIFVGGTVHDGVIADGQEHLGNTDYWIAKFTNDGDEEWIRQNGTEDQDGKFGMDIIPDNQGGARLAVLTFEKRVVNVFDYSVSGSRSSVWDRSVSNYRDSPIDLVLTANDEVILVGRRGNSSGGNDGFIIKVSSSGIDEWEPHFIGNGDRIANRVIVDQNNDVFVSGFDKINSMNANAWITKYSETGNQAWIKQEQSQGFNDDYIKKIGINPNGDVIIAGSTEGVLGESRQSGEDAWVSSRDSNTGELKWINQFAVRGNNSIEAIAFDNNDGIILAGRTERWKYNNGSTNALLMRFSETLPNSFQPVITSYSVQTANGVQYLQIDGGNLFNVTSVRINGVPQGIINNTASQIQTDISGVSPGSATVSVSANCITQTGSVMIN